VTSDRLWPIYATPGEQALTDLVGLHAVDAAVDGGSIVVTVTVESESDVDAVTATLGRYALTRDVKERR
jgi:fatty-acyl-CoA synthase